MQRLETRLPGLILLQPTVHGDDRGFFVETFRESVFAQVGIETTFVQHNHSRSSKGVLRGMHYQLGLAKHVRCARGRILDVVVDIRRGSPSFGEWEAYRWEVAEGAEELDALEKLDAESMQAFAGTLDRRLSKKAGTGFV